MNLNDILALGVEKADAVKILQRHKSFKPRKVTAQNIKRPKPKWFFITRAIGETKAAKLTAISYAVRDIQSARHKARLLAPPTERQAEIARRSCIVNAIAQTRRKFYFLLDEATKAGKIIASGEYWFIADKTICVADDGRLIHEKTRAKDIREFFYLRRPRAANEALARGRSVYRVGDMYFIQKSRRAVKRRRPAAHTLMSDAACAAHGFRIVKKENFLCVQHPQHRDLHLYTDSGEKYEMRLARRRYRKTK